MFIPNASILLSRLEFPIFPSPITPTVFSAMSSPIDCCQPPARNDAFSLLMWRALARISADVSSTVGLEA